MKFHTSWRTLAGLAAVSAVLLAAAACGNTEKEQGAASAGPTAASAAAAPTPSAAKSWSQPPAMQIDPNKTYTAEIQTSKGSFTIELFAKDAPQTVNNFVFLAKEKFYNGITFHRIIETFMIQTGDPKGNGTGGPGYTIPDELPPKYKYDPGIVAMAKSSQPNSGGSQFFIVTGNASHLNSQPNYTVFGKVISGMETVMNIAKTPVKVNPASGSKETPTEKVTIETVKIVEK